MTSKRLITSVYLSNALEFFEYTLFGALSVTIQKTYFQSVSWINPYTLTMFAFCISLLVRPLGSLIFGYIGDKISRLLSLQLSIACMTISSLTMALLPGTESIGEIAIWIVLLSRIIQGISAGGEYNGAAIFAIESYSDKPWKTSGYLTSSAIMGLVLASVAAMVLSMDGLPDYSYRIAFGFGTLIGVSSYLLRRVPKSPTNIETFTPEKLEHKWPLFFAIFFIGGQTSALSYFSFVTLKNALAKLPQFNSVNISYYIASMLLLASLSCIGFATIAQRLNSRKIMHLGIGSVIILIPVCLALFSIPNILISSLALIVLALVLGMHGATQHAYFQSFVPKHLRQRFISISFSLGTGILSSLVIWMTTGLDLAFPSMVVFSFSLISIGALICVTLLENRYGIPNKTTQRNVFAELKSAS